MSLILILRRFTEMGHLSNFKSTFCEGLLGSTKYYRFYVIDFNFAKVYRNGTPLYL